MAALPCATCASGMTEKWRFHANLISNWDGTRARVCLGSSETDIMEEIERKMSNVTQFQLHAMR